MDGTEEVASRLVVASGDGAVLLEPGEEVLDEVASLVEMAVVVARLLARAARRDDHSFVRCQQWLDHPSLGVERPIGDEAVGFVARQQRIGAFEIMGLAGREMKARRVAEGIDRGVDLGAQAPAAAPEGLLNGRPPFFLGWQA